MSLVQFLYTIYKWIFAYPVMVIITFIVTLSITFGSLLFGSKWWGYYPAHFWGKCWCWLLFVKVEVRGKDNIDKNTSYVFVANHQGAYDIFSIYGFLGHNFKWMMKKSLEKIPFVGMACKYSEQIMVDRSSPMAMARSVIEARKRLCNGMSLVVFPEGTRTLDGKMLSFKKGAFKLAMDFKLPLVPITIDGAYKVLPRTSKFDIILLDPPYAEKFLENSLNLITEIDILESGGIIIAERPAGKELNCEFEGFSRSKDYKYGKTLITLYRKIAL